MLVIANDRGFRIDYMNEDDLRSLRSLIKTGSSTESHNWQGVLNEIDTILRDK